MNKRIVAYSLTLLAIVWLTVFVNSAIAEIDIPETVLIQPGNFMMGMDVTSDTLGVDGYTGATEFKEAPAHQVTLTRSYAMGKYEITNQQFADFVDAGGYNNWRYWIIDSSYHEAPFTGWIWRLLSGRTAPGHSAASWDLNTDPYWKDDPYSNQADTPVIGIVWYEAYAYCKWLSEETGETFRLPTEAEWEYAARGPNSNVFPWGNEYLTAEEMCGLPGTGAKANCGIVPEESDHSREMAILDGVTQPVGSYLEGVSYWGCYDMAGNISELTADWFRGNYYPLCIDLDKTTDPQGPLIALPPFVIPVPPFWINPARTQRGTSYKMDSIGADNYSDWPVYPLRCSHRMFGFRYMGSSMVGFRVLKQIDD